MWEVFFGAFYLLLINSVFISAAAYGVVKVLRFPLHEHINPEKEKKRRIVYYAFLIIIIIPSIYIFYGIIVEAKVKNQVNSFLNQNLNKENSQVINWRIQQKGDTLKEIKIYLVGDKLPPERKDSLQGILPYYGLDGYNLDIREMGSSSDLKSDITQEIMNTIEQENQIDERDVEIERLNSMLKSRTLDSSKITGLLADIRTFNPEIRKLGFSYIDQKEIRPDTTIILRMPTLLMEWSESINNSEQKEQEAKIYEFIKQELAIDTLQIVKYAK